MDLGAGWWGEHLVHVGVPAPDWPSAAPFGPVLGVGEDERFWGWEMGPKLTFARCFTLDGGTFFSILPLDPKLYPKQCSRVKYFYDAAS